MGFLYGKKLFPFNTPLDLLRFGGLKFWGRIRTALGGAYIAKMLNDAKGLGQISVSEWLGNIFGAGGMSTGVTGGLPTGFGRRFGGWVKR